MEFGALHCKPVAPNCKVCPLEGSCFAILNDQVNTLPLKLNKLKVKERDIHYLVWINNGEIFMKKRGEGDIWNGLYDFWELNGKDIPSQNIANAKIYTHKLTHQKLQIRFYISHVPPKNSKAEDYTFYSFSEIENLPKPIIIKQFLDAQKLILEHK